MMFIIPAKNGITAQEAPTLFKTIRENMSNLALEGIMTIGAFGHDYSLGPNPDFVSLMQVHAAVCNENLLEADKLQVSMGMSDDFEKAVCLLQKL